MSYDEEGYDPFADLEEIEDLGELGDLDAGAPPAPEKEAPKGGGILSGWLARRFEEREYWADWGGPELNEALRGAKGGTSVLISGPPNHGKSQLTTSLVISLLRKNSDIKVIDFTFDDDSEKRLIQYTASMSNIPQNDVDFANYLTPEKREKLLSSVREVEGWMSAGALKMYQAVEDGKNQATVQFIMETVAEERQKEPDGKIVVVVDSLNDVELPRHYTDALEREGATSREMHKIIEANNVLLLATAHLKKTGGRRPTLEDLKGNNFLAYQAKVCVGIHNDVKLKKRSAEVYWRLDGDATFQERPIIEAHFLKCKVSSFNGVICYRQDPSSARVVECDAEEQESYRDLIYGG